MSKSFKSAKVVVPKIPPTATVVDSLPTIQQGIAIMSLGPPSLGSISDDESQSSRGRSRVRVRPTISRYRSASRSPIGRDNRADEAVDDEGEEFDGNEHLQHYDPVTVLGMVVGAEINEWFKFINELRTQEASGLTDPPSVSVLNALKRFTNLRNYGSRRTHIRGRGGGRG